MTCSVNITAVVGFAPGVTTLLFEGLNAHEAFVNPPKSGHANVKVTPVSALAGPRRLTAVLADDEAFTTLMAGAGCGYGVYRSGKTTIVKAGLLLLVSPTAVAVSVAVRPETGAVDGAL